MLPLELWEKGVLNRAAQSTRHRTNIRSTPQDSRKLLDTFHAKFRLVFHGSIIECAFLRFINILFDNDSNGSLYSSTISVYLL